jgi:hypothetical protein
MRNEAFECKVWPYAVIMPCMLADICVNPEFTDLGDYNALLLSLSFGMMKTKYGW